MGNETASTLEKKVDDALANDSSASALDDAKLVAPEVSFTGVDKISVREKVSVAAGYVVNFGFMAALLGIIGVGLAQGLGSLEVAQKLHELSKDTHNVNVEYAQWQVANPDATMDEKQRFILASVANNVEDTKHVGVAFDSADTESVCLWQDNAGKSSVTNAISLTSRSNDCSRLDILASPEGSNIVKDTSEVIPETPKKIEDNNLVPNALGVIGTIIGGVAVVGGAGIGVNKIAGRKRRKKSSTEKWNAVISRHDDIRKQWAAYELDPMKMLDYPMLSDMREQVTVDLHMALRKAKNLRPADIKTVAHEDADESKYEKAVSALETAFQVAENEAKLIQWGKFSVAEQKRLTTAKTLLNFVLDGGATEFERQAAYKRLNKEIGGLINIPAPTILVIEEQLRSMIEA